MRHRRRALPVAFLLASVAFVAPLRARAQPSDAVTVVDGLDVEWATPTECPSSGELRRRVAARLPVGLAVRARGRVEKRAARYRLALEVSTASSRGERVLEAVTCEELVESAAVVIAMSVAPAAERAREEEAAAAAAAPPSAPPPAASTSPERPSEAPARRAGEAPSRVLVRAELSGDAGLLPSAALGGGLAVGVVLGRDLSLEANADLFGSQDGTVGGSVAGATFGLITGGVRACYALTHGFEIAPCVGVEVARIAASGFGAVKVTDADSVTWGPEALVAGRFPVAGPISVRFGLGAFVPISRQSFVINAAGTVHQPGAVALRTWFGPEVRF